MKLCINCKHHVPRDPPYTDQTGEDFSKCGRMSVVSPVNGKRVWQGPMYCSTQRLDMIVKGAVCGPEAVYFEEKTDGVSSPARAA